MSSNDVIINRSASQMEEHLTNALVYVVSQYWPVKSEAGLCERSNRISALINVLSWEIAGAHAPEDRDVEIRGLLSEVQWRVARSTGDRRRAPTPVAH